MTPLSEASPGASRFDALRDVLENRFLHRVLVLSNLPAAWPPVLAAAVLIAAVGGVGGVWSARAGAGVAPYIVVALALFVAGDALVLASLPRLRISFGPVAPQLLVLAAPRLAVGGALAFAVPFVGTTVALASVLVINAAALAALVWGALREPAEVRSSLVHMPVDWLAADAPPLRLLHISDVHVERMGRREESVLQLVRQVNPELVLLTGDYVNLSGVDDPASHVHARRFLEALCDGRAGPNGSPLLYAVLGSPPVDRNSAPLFQGLAVRLLRDEVVTVRRPDGSRVALIGLDCSHDSRRDALRLEHVASLVAPQVPRVLLYHSPELMPVAARLGIEMYLCGHTHGGQVRLPLYGALVTSSRLGKRYEMGRYSEGRTQLYVSRGIGFEGLGAPRVRFLCPPEITLWVLTPRLSTSSTPGLGLDRVPSGAQPARVGPTAQ